MTNSQNELLASLGIELNEKIIQQLNEDNEWLKELLEGRGSGDKLPPKPVPKHLISAKQRRAINGN